MKVDRVLIVMPEYLEDVLWCLPVGQMYLMYGQWKLDRPSETTVVCRKEFEFLMPSVFPQSKICQNVTDEELESFCAVIVFDRERAMQMAKPTVKNAVESYGILCGSSPQLGLPTMGQPLEYEPFKIVLVQRSLLDYRGVEYQYPFDKSRDVFEQVFKGANIVELPNNASVELAYKEIGSAAFVLGVVGGYTLMAAAMMKPLLELYPEKTLFHKNWSAKWANPFYRMIAAELGQVPGDFLALKFDKFIGEVVQQKGVAWRSPTTRDSTNPVEEQSMQTVPSP